MAPSGKWQIQHRGRRVIAAEGKESRLRFLDTGTPVPDFAHRIHGNQFPIRLEKNLLVVKLGTQTVIFDFQTS